MQPRARTIRSTQPTASRTNREARSAASLRQTDPRLPAEVEKAENRRQVVGIDLPGALGAEAYEPKLVAAASVDRIGAVDDIPPWSVRDGEPGRHRNPPALHLRLGERAQPGVPATEARRLRAAAGRVLLAVVSGRAPDEFDAVTLAVFVVEAAS